jgi:hypothetical protein
MAPPDAHFPTLEGLPVELKSSIFRELSDLPTLQNLALSSKLYYDTFTGEKRNILRNFLKNALATRVLDDLYYVIQARKVARGDWSSYMTEFVENYREDEEIMPKDVGIEDLVAIANSLGKVHIVAKEFLKDTMSQNPLTREDLNIGIRDLSKNEVRRIYGALIKFELYCAVCADAEGNYGHPTVDSGNLAGAARSILNTGLFMKWKDFSRKLKIGRSKNCIVSGSSVSSSTIEFSRAAEKGIGF